MIETSDRATASETSLVPDLNRLAQFFIDAFPVMNITEQRLALKLYTLSLIHI